MLDLFIHVLSAAHWGRERLACAGARCPALLSVTISHLRANKSNSFQLRGTTVDTDVGQTGESAALPAAAAGQRLEKREKSARLPQAAHYTLNSRLTNAPKRSRNEMRKGSADWRAGNMLGSHGIFHLHIGADTQHYRHPAAPLANT